MTMKRKLKQIFYAVIAAFLCVVTIVCGQFNVPAFADTSEGVRAAYENINVWDNLQGAVIGGHEFDIKDYPYKENDKPRIIQFVELCYSYYSDKQSDYGLYIYVYNPQNLVFDTETKRNTINMKCGNLDTEVYTLEFLNYCNKAGYEGRFYEFKVNLNAAETYSVLHNLDADSRVYEITSFTLSVKGELETYAYAQKWTYTGYVKGYGSELAESDTLECTVDGFQKYVELDVKHTTYRQQGDYYNGEQSQLDSCYFRVPNKYFEDYGALSKISMQWHEYFTKPILVTDSSFVYNRINSLHGSDTNNLSDDIYFLATVLWENINSAWFKTSQTFSYSSNYGYKPDDEFKFGFGGAHQVRFHDALHFSNFAATFYTGGKSLDDYEVSSKDLEQKLLSNSSSVGGEMLNDRYSKYLFENYVQQGAGVYNHEYGLNRKEVTDKDFETTFWNVTTKGLWQTIFGGFDSDTLFDEKKAFEIITEDMLQGSDSQIAADLFVNENDVTSIKSEFYKAQALGERLVLLRYSSTKYMCAPAIIEYCSKANINEGQTLCEQLYDKWDDKKYNAYVAQETVYLDFQIISLWFTADDGTETEVPVVMTPQDYIPSLSPPLDENYHNEKTKGLLALFIAAIIVVVIIILVLVFLPKLGVAIVTGPFKAIGRAMENRRERKAQIKLLKQSRKDQMAVAKYQADLQRKENNRQQKLEKKDQMAVAKYQADLQRKENKRQQKLDEKDAQKAQKAKDKQAANRRKKAKKRAKGKDKHKSVKSKGKKK